MPDLLHEIRRIAWKTIAELLGITEPTDVLTGASSAKFLRGDGTWSGTTTGPCVVSDATNSTSTTTGSIITAGGIGIAKDVWIGGLINVAGTSSLIGNVGIGTTTTNVGGQATDVAVLTLKSRAVANGSAIELVDAGTTANNDTLGTITFFDGTTANAFIQAARSSSTDSAYVRISTRAASGSLTERMRITEAGLVTIASLTASRAVFSDSAKGLVSNAISGTGDVVMTNNATLVAPALGTPASGVATNLTGTASGLTAGAVAVGGITGLASNVATFLAASSSANLAAALTDETGGGLAVFGTAGTNWTPSDQSGGSLTFTSVTARYVEAGRCVKGWAKLTFPATADANFVAIGGLPRNATGVFHIGIIAGVATYNFIFTSGSNAIFNAYNAAVSAAGTNIQFTGAAVYFFFQYEY